MALQIKRGTNLQRLELLLAEGEPFYVTNAVALGVAPMWIGDGVTFGGVASMSPVTIDELSDIEIITPANNNVLQYDSSVGQWKNSANLTVTGTTALNGAVTATAGVTSKTTDAFSADVAYPVVLDHTHSKTAAYAGIATVTGDTVVTFAANPAVMPYTRIRLSNVGTIGQMTGIAINTTYYVYGIDAVSVAPAVKMKLASTKANAIAGIPLGTTGSCGNGTATFRAMPGFGVGVERTVDMAASSVIAMRDAVVATNELTGSETFDYDVYLKNAGALPSTPQLRVSGNGTVTISDVVSNTVTVANNIDVNGLTESTSTTTGAVTVSGGVGVSGRLNVGGAVSVGSFSTPGAVAITNTTASTTPDTGALTVDGGVGINGNLNLGTNLNVAGVTKFTSTDQCTSVDSGAIQIDGGVGINKNVFVGGYFEVQNQAVIQQNLTVGGDLIVNGTTTTVNSTTVTIDDKNIELGSVATPTDITANGGGITLKGDGDKTITWSSSTGRWASNVGFNTPGSLIGNVHIANGTDDNTISTSTGNLILDSATNTVQIDANVTHTGNTTQTGTLTTGGILANKVEIGLPAAGTIGTSLGPLTFYAESAESILFAEENPVTFFGVAQFGATADTTHGMYFYSRARTDLTFDAQDSANTMHGVRGVIGTNDHWFVGGRATGTDVGSLVLATGDNQSEPILVRQYSGLITAGNSSYRELSLLDSAGNTGIPGALTVNGNIIRSSTTAAAITLSGSDVVVGGDLTIGGNDIKASNGSTAITLNGTAATIAGDFAVNGTLSTFNNVDINGTLQDGVTLEQAFAFTYDENNDRVNRPTFRSTTGNSSGMRVSAPNATTSAVANIGAFSSNDDQNGKFINLSARGATSNDLRIQTGKYTAGVLGASGTVVSFVDNVTAYATVNPAGTTTATDLSTKSYTDTAISTAITALNLGTSNLVTSTTAANQILDIVPMAAFRTVKYIVQATSAGAGTHVMECLVMHDNTTAYITVYGEMFSASSLTNISVTVSGSDMHLLVSPTNAVTSYKVTKTSITA